MFTSILEIHTRSQFIFSEVHLRLSSLNSVTYLSKTPILSQYEILCFPICGTLFGLMNTYSLKQPDQYYLEPIKMTSRRVFSVNFDQVCDVIFMVSK